VSDLDAIGAPSIFKLIRDAAALARMFPTLDLSYEENAVRSNGTIFFFYEARAK
jgi:hypothetical protein